MKRFLRPFGLSLAFAAILHLAMSVAVPQPLGAAHNIKLTNLAVNAESDAVCALLDGGFIDGYSGTQPATGDTGLSGNTLLFSLPLNATACGASSAGVATFNAITSDTDADATGTVTWARFRKSDHTTAVFDVTAGATSGFDLNLNTASIVQHATVTASGTVTYTSSKG